MEQCGRIEANAVAKTVMYSGTDKVRTTLFHNGSSLKDPGPHGDLFMFKVQFCLFFE